MKIIVAITGASGGVYARLCLEQLLQAEEVEQIALIVSDTAHKVLEFEGVELPKSEKIVCYNNDDMFSPVASGSAAYDAMVVVPASMGSVGRIASGVSLSLRMRYRCVMPALAAVAVSRSLRLRDSLAWVLLAKSAIWTAPHVPHLPWFLESGRGAPVWISNSLCP